MAKKNAKLILVTGATGHQGGAALKHLRQKGFAVRAMTRDPDKPTARALIGPGTEVVRGDLNDPASLARALDGVDGVYSVLTPYEEGTEAETRQGINLADAANRAHVGHFVYSSVGSADQKTGIPHFESKFRVEEHIRGTGLSYTILRPVFFMENLLTQQESMEKGTITFPISPDTRLQIVAVDDIGAFVAMAFEHPDRWRGRTIELAGDELSMAEIAQGLSRIEGREVRYVQVPWADFEKQAGREATLMHRWFQDVGYRADIPAVRQERPGLMNFERWMQTTLRAAVASAR